MKIKITLSYPWAGVRPDEQIVEIPDDLTPREMDKWIDDIANDMVWNTVSCESEVIEE